LVCAFSVTASLHGMNNSNSIAGKYKTLD